MTHENERKFGDRIEEELNTRFGRTNVRREVYLQDTRRYADFLVEGELQDYAIEVENDWEACLKGVGQAILYANHFDNCKPVVVVPKGHVEYPEVTKLREDILVWELSEQ